MTLASAALLAAYVLASASARDNGRAVHGHWSLYDDVRLGTACFYVQQVTVHLDHLPQSSSDGCLDLPDKSGVRYCIFDDKIFDSNYPDGVDRAEYVSQGHINMDEAEGFTGNLLSLRESMESCQKQHNAKLLINLDLSLASGSNPSSLVDKLHDLYTDSHSRKLPFDGYDLAISSDFTDGAFLSHLVNRLRVVGSWMRLAATSDCASPHADIGHAINSKHFDSIAAPLQEPPACNGDRSSRTYRRWLKQGGSRLLTISTDLSDRIAPDILAGMSCELKNKRLGGLMLRNLNGTMTINGQFYMMPVLQAVHGDCNS